MSEPEDRWQLSVEPDPLLPGRPAHLTLRFTPESDLEARGASAVLRCVETYRYDTTETSTGADGRTTSRTVTKTGHQEIHRIDYELQGPGRMAAGQPLQWGLDLEAPGLGPATFEGEELRCDWILEAKVDLPMKQDERLETSVHMAQPTALLNAGVVATGQYGLFEEAPTNVDAFPAQVRLEPVPLCLLEPFAGSFTVETDEPIEVQEVRLELRVKVHGHVSRRTGRGDPGAAWPAGGRWRPIRRSIRRPSLHRRCGRRLAPVDRPAARAGARGLPCDPGARLGAGHPLRARRGAGHHPRAVAA